MLPRETPAIRSCLPICAKFSRQVPDRAAIARRRSRTMAALAFFFSVSIGCQAAVARTEAVDTTPSPYSYADVADLVSPAEAIAVARLRSLVAVPNAAQSAPGAPQNFYVEADIKSLIRGNAALAPRIGFLIRLPATREAVRDLKGKTVLLFGRLTDQPGQFQLLSSTALLPWTPATEAKTLAIAAEVMKPDSPPQITRIAEAFHVAGTVAGESETQIFLTTAGGRPISLSIAHRPDIATKYGAALGEIVDEAADVPPPETLLWYRLSCSLPASLPGSAVAKLEAGDAEAAQTDYRAFMAKLGDCPRTRPAPQTAPQLGNPTDPG